MVVTSSDVKKLGLWTSTSLVVGNMIGSGVFMMPATLAAYGGISVLGWIFSAIGALLLAKVFSNLSIMMPVSDGGPYAYTRKGMGDFAGFLVAWGYLISTWCTNAAISVAFVGAMSTFIPDLAVNNLMAVLFGLGAIWFLTWINTLGIVASGKMQLLTTLLKLIPLILVCAGGLFFIDFNNFIPFNMSGTSDFSAITATATLTFFAFLGMECATIPSSSVANPEKTIPKATMMGTILTTVIYIFSSISVMGMIPAEVLQKSVTPFADAASIIFGPEAVYWVGGGVAIAAFGTLNGFILVQGQVADAMAVDRLFPAIFCKKNKNGVASAGLIIGSIIVSMIMLMNYTKGLANQFKFLILLSTLTVLVPYLFSAASLILIKIQNKIKSGNWFSTIMLASMAFLFSLWAVSGSGQDTVYYGFMMLMAGIPIYVWMMWKRQSS
ncbi:MAG: amino acid permease [Saprospiraceae bacterium]|nr:amino acid permease [Saprospiraceae bacterium]